MRYFITGSRGFAAGHLVERLLENSDNFVVGLDCLYSCASKRDPFNATENNYLFVKGNLNDKDLITHLLSTYHFDFILHLSAQSHVDLSFSSPHIYALDNFMATLELLECVKSMTPEKRPKILHCSTDEVLGPSTDGKAKHEDSLLLPSNVYACTKAASECLINAYKCSHKLDVIIIRPNNLIAHRQYHEKVIPRFITLLKNNEPITIHGSGNQLRAYLHISDFISAVELILAKGVWGSIYHIPSDYEISVLDLAKQIAQIMGKEKTYQVRFVTDRLFNDCRYLNAGSALKNLGWSQKVTLKEALESTVRWYLEGKDQDYFIEEFEFPLQENVEKHIDDAGDTVKTKNAHNVNTKKSKRSKTTK